MQVTAYKTDIIQSGSHNLLELLDSALPTVAEGSIVAISSKVVALCEGRTVPIEGNDKDELIKQESSRYLPRSTNRYNVSFTITRHMFVPTAGIDESNGNGQYVLWPEDLQASANMVRHHLAEKHGLQSVGVILTDNCLRPLRWGVTGIAIAASGFVPVQDDIGQPDLFGRPLQYTRTSMQDGLAAAAALVMGEGNRSTPIAVLTDLPFVTFVPRDPTDEELAAQLVEPEDDMYSLFLANVPWQPGDRP